MEHSRVRKSGVRWSMLEYERVVLGGTCKIRKSGVRWSMLE